jgi:peptide deformylase
VPMRLDIVHWPDPVLLKPAKVVEGVDDELRDVVAQMGRIMHDLRGVGLAGPQVGLSRRLMLVCPTGEPGEETAVINPEILSREGLGEMEEGCLSFPGIYGVIERPERVTVRYRDLDWAEKTLELDGFVARVFQHEFDHLNGVVFIDRMTPADKMKNRAPLDDLKRAYSVRATA